MKVLSKLSFILLVLLFTSCNKEGVGGTSSISGKVMGVDHDPGRVEITNVSFSHGNTVEHGDYWLLNSPYTNAYFYIWYENPGWVSNGDPGLLGRTGVKVVFNYSDSNIDIATNTMNALDSITNAFDFQLTNDVLTITNTTIGSCPDAEDVTSPFSFDVVQQGRDVTIMPAEAMIDYDVYIEYGDQLVHSDINKTSVDGTFQFTNLQKGNYEIYVLSKDTINGGQETISKSLEITTKKTNYTVDDFVIVY